MNQFCFMLTLDNFTAICFTAAFYFFNHQKIYEKCDLMRPSRMNLVNPFRFKSFFNVGCPMKIWTETLIIGMRRNSLHCKSLVLGYYPILPEMFWSSVFLIFRRKNRLKIIFDGSYGKLFSRSFSFYFSTDFSIHSFLNNSWGNLVYKRNQGVECHGNHRTQLYQMLMHSKLEITARRSASIR